MGMALDLDHLRKWLDVRNLYGYVRDLPRVVLWDLLNIPDIILRVPNNCCLQGVADKMDLISMVPEGAF